MMSIDINSTYKKHYKIDKKSALRLTMAEIDEYVQNANVDDSFYAEYYK